MKKISLLCLLLALAVLKMTAQGQGEFKIGIRVSPMICMAKTFDKDKNDIPGLDMGSRLGIGVGPTVRYGLSDNIMVQSGINLAVYGYKSDFSLLGVTSSSKVGINYLELPIDLKLRTGEVSDGLTITALFGASLAANVGYKAETTTGGITTTYRKTDAVNFFNAGYRAGAGVDFELPTGMLDVGVIYNGNFININHKKHSTNITNTSYIALSAAYFF